MKYAKILVTLTLAAAANSFATWFPQCWGKFSPDGTKIAFPFYPTGGYDMYIVNADGSGRVKFDVEPGLGGEPYFSPDGKRIAFINHYWSFRNRNIFLVDVDGRNLRQVTAYGDDPYETADYWDLRIGVLDEGLTFSPDGRKILYCSEEFGSSDIFAVNVDGTGKTRLTSFAEYDESRPVFLPDGDKMLFTVMDSDSLFSGEGEIWMMNADGSGKKELLGGAYAELVAVSPDGKRIAYVESCDQASPVYLAELDGSSRIKIAEEDPDELDLSFSPDGKKVLYCQDGGVYVINADGSARKNLTPGRWGVLPAFFAGGAKIAFAGPFGIWTVEADGSDLKFIKATAAVDISYLVVSPSSDWLLLQGGLEHESVDDYFYVVNVDGSGLARLTPEYDSYGGKFSADGSKIAFVSNEVSRGGLDYSIYTANADGTGRVEFELPGGVWGEPYFSPDGREIAFVNTDWWFVNGNVLLVDVDGTNLSQVTAYGDDPFEKTNGPARRIGVLDEGLTFSPDGRKILYCSREFGSSDIFAVNVDGTGKTRLTDLAGHNEYCPAFLPGGEEILFAVTGSWEKGGIWIMNSDGSGKRRLSCMEDAGLIAVSPDGKKIMVCARYPSEYSGDFTYATFVVDLDGSSRIKIADEDSYWLDPSFSPDGKKVLYSFDRDVYVVNADGSGRKALTSAWYYVSEPAFLADGGKIVFSGARAWVEDPVNIFTVNADGSDLELFKAMEGMYVSDIVVSPTGDRFLFQGDYEGDVDYTPDDYFVVNADGSGLKRLTKKGGFPDD